MPQVAESPNPGSDRQRVLLGPKGILELWNAEGEMNVETVENWISALRDTQERKAKSAGWIGKVSILQEVCRSFLKNQAWIKSIGLEFEEEPEQIYIYVVPESYDALTIQGHRQVAALGLLMGKALDARVESRISGGAPGLQISRLGN